VNLPEVTWLARHRIETYADVAQEAYLRSLSAAKTPDGAASLDLGLHTSVLRENRARIGSKTCISEQELQRAQAIAEALLAFAGARELSPAAKAEAADVRDPAFTVLVDRFEEERRVVTCVRWH